MSLFLEVFGYGLYLKPPALILKELLLDSLLALCILSQVLEHVQVVLAELVYLLVSGAQEHVLLPQGCCQLLYLDLAVLVDTGKRHMLLRNHLETGIKLEILRTAHF